MDGGGRAKDAGGEDGLREGSVLENKINTVSAEPHLEAAAERERNSPTRTLSR